MPRTRRASVLSILLLLVSSSSLPAVEILPGNILVAKRGEIVLLDPGRREPQVVSSDSVGGGIPFPRVRAMDLGLDGFLYAVDLSQLGGRVVRIDPASGDRELLSSNDRGDGPFLRGLTSIEVGRDGKIYVSDVNSGSSFRGLRILQIDPTSGDRTLLLETDLDFAGQGVVGLQELPNGEFTLAVSGDRVTGGSTIRQTDLAAGTLRTVSATIDTPIRDQTALASAGRSIVITIPSGGVPARLVDLTLDGRFVRDIASCADDPPPFGGLPTGVATGVRTIVLTTSFESDNCRLPGMRSLAGQVWRIDPFGGVFTLLYESEPVPGGADLSSPVVVPDDFRVDDSDGDSVPDAVDNCPEDANVDQSDLDGNGVGDRCNDFEDADADDIADALDLCPDDFDPPQADIDGDGLGDACDAFPEDPSNAAAALAEELARVQQELLVCRGELPVDADGDGRPDAADLCPMTPAGDPVDADGCSLEQFCGSFAPIRHFDEVVACRVADWRNDEPFDPRDCRSRMNSCVPR